MSGFHDGGDWAVGNPNATKAWRREKHRQGFRLRSDQTSAVAIVKEKYRQSSKRQRQMLRAWFRRVLSGEDGNL